MFTIAAVTGEGEALPIVLKSITFKGGEIHPTIDHLQENVRALRVRAHLKDSDAVMRLLLITDALRRAYPGAPVELEMPYVPYARQDRVANCGEALGAKVFCDLINSQGYSRVIIQDPHSDVVSALLDRVDIEDPVPALREVVGRIWQISHAQPALVAPDAGARKRVMKLAKESGCSLVFADKTRDTHTLEITGTAIQSELPGGPLLVVDDICDGGRTFIALAAAIRAQNYVHPLYLYVTHGIFSYGLDLLLEHFDRVYTRNNWTEDQRAIVV
jgi:ribose-phosphate pyrophosphokinase